MANPHEHKKHHHHILPDKMLLGVGASLLCLTILTVVVAHINLGHLNFIIAMAIATLKGSLVTLIFMNLWFDKKENGVIFATSFLFLAIFIVLTSTDLFFRGDVYVKGPLVSAAKSKLKNPWISTPQLITRGKQLFAVNCIACHGPEGKGNGPAATALNPHPRNFTSPTEHWDNGRKVSMVFKTLREGVNGTGMASFSTLPADDRWALDHYVLSLGPNPPEKDTPADFKKAGIDLSAGGGEQEEKSISVELAMERMTVEGTAEAAAPSVPSLEAAGMERRAGFAAHTYTVSCAQCHGNQGEGGIHVKNLGVNPVAFVTTRPLTAVSPGLSSEEAFNHAVIRGIPGEIMPGHGQFSGGELRELYAFVRGLRAAR